MGLRLIAVGLAACGGDDARETPEDREQPQAREDRRFVRDDDGAVCLTPQSDGAVAVDVAFDVCFSSGCDTAEVVSCQAAIAGDRVELTSHLEKVTPARYEACNDDCHHVKVSCGVLEPFAGSRVFEHGAEQSNAVSFPLTEAVQLFDSGDCEYASYARSF